MKNFLWMQRAITAIDNVYRLPCDDGTDAQVAKVKVQPEVVHAFNGYWHIL